MPNKDIHSPVGPFMKTYHKYLKEESKKQATHHHPYNTRSKYNRNTKNYVYQSKKRMTPKMVPKENQPIRKSKKGKTSKTVLKENNNKQALSQHIHIRKSKKRITPKMIRNEIKVTPKNSPKSKKKIAPNISPKEIKRVSPSPQSIKRITPIKSQPGKLNHIKIQEGRTIVDGSDSYTFINKLGAGQSSVVWKVNKNNNEVYALKVFFGGDKSDKNLLKAVQNEIFITNQAADANHAPKCFPFLNYFNCILMEFLDANQFINVDINKFTINDYAKLLPAINKLINDLCEKNIKHGDPNLQNILYDSSNKKVYLIDYGMSKIIDKKDKDYNLLKQKNLISYYNLFTKLETVLMKRFDLKNHPILTGNPLIDVKTGKPAISILHFAQADGVIDSIVGTYNTQRAIKERQREKEHERMREKMKK